MKAALISLSSIVVVKSKQIRNVISKQSEIPNHISAYYHKIHYKKLFRHPTLEQYVHGN